MYLANSSTRKKILLLMGASITYTPGPVMVSQAASCMELGLKGNMSSKTRPDRTSKGPRPIRATASAAACSDEAGILAGSAEKKFSSEPIQSASVRRPAAVHISGESCCKVGKAVQRHSCQKWRKRVCRSPSQSIWSFLSAASAWGRDPSVNDRAIRP